MSVAEFIIAAQWPLLILLLAAPLALGMVVSSSFREAVLKRNVRIGVDGVAFEHPQTDPLALEAATASDRQIADALGEDEAPESGPAEVPSMSEPDPEVTEYRREAVEVLMRDAAHWGWRQAQMGFRSPPDPYVDWEASGGPSIQYGVASLPSGGRGIGRKGSRGSAHPEEIARRIRRERAKRHLTVEQLAAKAGLSAQVVRRIEQDDVSAKPEQVRAIAAALGVSPKLLSARFGDVHIVSLDRPGDDTHIASSE